MPGFLGVPERKGVPGVEGPVPVFLILQPAVR